MKKIVRQAVQFLMVLAAIAGACTLYSYVPAHAAYLPLDPTMFQNSDIPVPPAEATSGQEIVKQLVFGALNYAKVIAAVMGIFFLTIIGYRLVILGDNEEEVTKAKSAVTVAIIAFVMISMAKDLARIFDMAEGSFLRSPQEILKRVHLFDKEVEVVIIFIKYTIGALATLMVIISAMKLITAGGNDEEVTKHRKSLLVSIGGLVLLYVGDIFINNVLYKVNKNVYTGITGVHPSVDVKAGVEELVGITNFIVSFVGPLAILMLIVGAILYASAAGEDERMERAKRVLITTLIGMVLIFGAFAIVSTVISGKLEGINAITATE